MCEFLSLYFGDDGYVVRCKQCDHYQVAFASSMLNLTDEEFKKTCNVVRRKYEEEENLCNNPSAKSIVIPTPSAGVYLLLTKEEAKRLHEILEEADNEEQALAMMSLFNK